MTLLSLFGRYSYFKFRFFSKMSIFLKCFKLPHNYSSNYLFLNIQYCKIYFHYGLGLAKSNYNDPASFFWKKFPFLISFFFKNVHFSQIFKFPHNTARTTYFENIQYCRIYFHYGVGLTKTSYNDSASFSWKIFLFQISIF